MVKGKVDALLGIVFGERGELLIDSKEDIDMTFYRCKHCGNIIAHIQDSGVRCHCCGEEMKPLTPNTTDAAGEKHVPVIAVNGQIVTVTVGSVEHPMLDAHYIQ